MAITVADLETKIKTQAGIIAVLEMQLTSLQQDNAALKAQIKDQEPQPVNRAARRKGK